MIRKGMHVIWDGSDCVITKIYRNVDNCLEEIVKPEQIVLEVTTMETPPLVALVDMNEVVILNPI